MPICSAETPGRFVTTPWKLRGRSIEFCQRKVAECFPHTRSMNDPRPHLLHDALGILDRYSGKLGNRDPAKSLNEDQNEVLRRVRVALEPLIFNGKVRRNAVADLAARIDAVLAPAAIEAESAQQSADSSRNSICNLE